MAGRVDTAVAAPGTVTKITRLATEAASLVEDRRRERRVETVGRDFVANVSHELKTPVGAISFLAETVAEASGDPEAVERFAQGMLTESDRLSRLVQQRAVS